MTDTHAQRLTLLSGMAMLLQSCTREDELFDVTYWYLPNLFSGIPGRICLIHKHREAASQVFSWGDETLMAADPMPEQCKVLKKGIFVFAGQDPCACGAYCVPFKDKNQTFGALCLGNPHSHLPEQYRGLAFITAEYLALAVSNIRLQRQLHEMTLRDPLTGLYNRRYMDEVLAREIPRARRAGTTLGVVMIDLDHFKRFNDTFGHDAGDHVLKTVAYTLTCGIRTEDTVCRFGGEEFVIFMTAGRINDYLGRAGELKEQIAGLDIHWQKQSVGRVTASLGVAVFPVHGDTGDRLVRQADQALYKAKEQGRNQVVCASPCSVPTRSGKNGEQSA